jgi:hypothetical protein
VQSPRILFVEDEGRGTPPPDSQGPDQRIFEGSGSIPQSELNVFANVATIRTDAFWLSAVR